MNILVIGAGQLGSRHLQSLMKFPARLNIYVVDNSSESLAVSKSRVAEVENHSHTEVVYFLNLDEVKDTHFFLTVIATSSAPRLTILSEVLERFESKNIILEKFLFQDIKSYETAKSLISVSKSSVFVNCPLRTYPIFNEIKREIDAEGVPVSMEYRGGEWIGLACNSIHYIDLLGFLSDSELQSIDCSNIDSEIIPSKREGYVEFTGNLICEYSSGTRLQLESVGKSQVDSTIVISFGEKCYEIDELSGDYNYSKSSHLIKSDRYTVPYQSDLTHKMLDQLVKTGSCELSKFDESSNYHKKFLHAMLDKYNEINKTKSKVLPIT